MVCPILFFRYNLEIINIHGRIKEGLKEMKVSHPQITTVLMGTRRSDPYSGTNILWSLLGQGQTIFSGKKLGVLESMYLHTCQAIT